MRSFLLSVVVPSGAVPTTSAADPQVALSNDIGVVQDVSVSAVRPCSHRFGVTLDHDSSAHVLCLGHCFQVVGVDTLRDSAQMVDDQPFGNWADRQFVSDPCGWPLPPVDTERSVSLPVVGCSPEPAGAQVGAVSVQRAIPIHLGPEPFINRWFSHHRGRLYAHRPRVRG